MAVVLLLLLLVVKHKHFNSVRKNLVTTGSKVSSTTYQNDSNVRRTSPLQTPTWFRKFGQN